MSRAEKYDLTEGNILRKLLMIATPVMGMQVVQMTYNLTDMFWLGRLSSDAVVSAGIPSMYIWLSVAFMLVGRMGAEIGVSQSLGRGDREAAKRYTGNSLMLAVGLGVVFGAVMILFRYPLIGFFSIQEANVAEGARTYLALVAIGIPFTFMSATIGGAFTGSGNSRTPFLINSIGLVLNMTLDPVVILLLGFGVAGAALLTSIIQMLICALMFIALKRHKNRPFAEYSLRTRPDRASIRQILKWSVPIGVESFLFCGLTMIITRFTSAFGASALAAVRVASQVESLSWLVGGGFGSAFTSFVGQNFGAGKRGRIFQGFKLSALVMGGYGLLITLLMYFCGGVFISVFLSDPEIVALGVLNLKIVAFCQISMCLEGVAAGAFRGEGRTLPPSIVSFICNALRVPLAFALSRTSLGLMGIWIAVTIGAIARGIWVTSWYLMHTKKRKKAKVAEE